MGNLLTCGLPSSTPAPASSTSSAVTDVDRAVLQLKSTRRKLDEQAKRLEAASEREKETARALVAKGDKRNALLALRKRKMHQTQVAQLDDWLMNVEQVLSSMAVAQNNAVVVSALQSGSKALKELQAQAPLDEVERLLEDTEDARRYQQEVADAVAVTLSPEEDAAATAELMALESDLLAAEAASSAAEPPVGAPLPSVPSGPALPAAPTHAVAAPAAAQGAPQAAVPA